MKVIDFKNRKYPAFQASGFSARFAFPFAEEICKGEGLDIGCNRKEWCFPGAIPVDPVINADFDAYHLPNVNIDYIFSSHCLEHLDNWVRALDYWIDSLTPKGHLFLYLPHYSQEYWRPWNNKKHLHVLHPHVIGDYLNSHPLIGEYFVSDQDLNNSFMVMAEKKL